MDSVVAKPSTSRLAIWSLVAALSTVVGPVMAEVMKSFGPIAALWRLALAGPVVAIVLGISALRRIKRSDGSVAGRGFAVAGITLGVLAIVAFVGLAVLLVLAFRSFTF